MSKKEQKKFEYKVITKTCAPDEQPLQVRKSCTQEEKDGWKLIDVSREEYPTHTNAPNDMEILMVFKREIP